MIILQRLDARRVEDEERDARKQTRGTSKVTVSVKNKFIELV